VFLLLGLIDASFIIGLGIAMFFPRQPTRHGVPLRAFWRGRYEHQCDAFRASSGFRALHLGHREVHLPCCRTRSTRAEDHRRGLAAAEQGRKSLELSTRQADEEIRKRRRGPRNHRPSGKAHGTDDRRGEERTKKRATARKRQPKAEIDQEVTRAREQLRDRVAFAGVAGAEKILRREVDARRTANCSTINGSSRWPNPAPSRVVRGSSFQARRRSRGARQVVRDARALAQVAQDARVRAAVADPNLSDAQVAGCSSPSSRAAERRGGEFRARSGAEQTLAAAAGDSRQFEALKNEREGVVEAEVQSRFELTEAQLTISSNAWRRGPGARCARRSRSTAS